MPDVHPLVANAVGLVVGAALLLATSFAVGEQHVPPESRGAAASAACSNPASDRSAVWAKPVVSPPTTRMPAPRARPEDSSSTRPSSSLAEDVRLSSTNTSAKSPPVRGALARVLLVTASASPGSRPKRPRAAAASSRDVPGGAR